MHVADRVAPVGHLSTVDVIHYQSDSRRSLPDLLLKVKIEPREHPVDRLVVRTSNQDRIVVAHIRLNLHILEAEIQFIYQ